MEGPVEVNAVTLEEAIEHVQEYKVQGQVDSNWKLLWERATIGQREADRFPKVTVWKVWLTILKSQA